MRIARLLACTVAMTPLISSAEEPATFDGRWNVTLTCPPHSDDDDAKGYVHRFPAEVKASEFRGTHATEDQPGWHLLTAPLLQTARPC
jgi:hypothetical protein